MDPAKIIIVYYTTFKKEYAEVKTSAYMYLSLMDGNIKWIKIKL